MDAFQFMMNSRNRTIGRNSPGRELDPNDSTDSSITQQDLKARKKKLESWAEDKGAAKRKREYDELGDIIKHKLEKRQDKLKKMLNIESHSDDEILIKKRKKLAAIETDSENSNDQDFAKSRSKKRQSLSTEKPKSWRFKIKIEESKENDNLAEESPNGRVLRTRRKPKHYDDFVLSEEENDTPTVKKKDLKIAPVFLKSTPKPKLDPKELEARRQFLMSGIPQSLRKEMEKQTNSQVEFDVFPTISHIQQKTDTFFWDLPDANLKLNSPVQETIETENFSGDFFLEKNKLYNELTSAPPIKNIKRVIKEIKSQNPDYPVFKMFNTIYEKSGCKSEDLITETQLKRRSRKKKFLAKKDAIQIEHLDNLLWTEKYKPKASAQIIGNQHCITYLKDWLSNWLQSRAPRKASSDSEFDITDSDSRDSFTRNTVILKGPTGSGKTSSVYAICNELDLSVLEVNASSKRTGKNLLQKLQEATKSHQVSTKTEQKICVLLVEDVDVIFEQDDGFSAALSQIIATSKRPIILTTTDDPTCTAIQKIINNNKTVSFIGFSQVLPIWLQIICLIEGFYLDLGALQEALFVNGGDIRKTLLHLQFFVSSGGEFNPKDTLEINDEDLKSEKELVFIHQDFLSSAISRNLEVIWWNLPSVLEFSQFGKTELTFYNTLSLVDTFSKNSFYDSFERRWTRKIKNSLGLEENMSCYHDAFSSEISNTLLELNMKICRRDTQNCELKLTACAEANRWRSKVFKSEEKLQEALLPSDSLTRKALVLDYLPCMRNIARSELHRSATTTRRGNRFYNYLRNIGVSAGESSYKAACDIFQ